MKILHAAIVAVLSLGLTGCAVSEQEFVQNRNIINKRPDIRAKLRRDCIADFKNDSMEKREFLAAFTDLKVATLPQTFCRRVEQAYLSGRLTYQDYKDVMHDKPTARLIRILRGK